MPPAAVFIYWPDDLSDRKIIEEARRVVAECVRVLETHPSPGQERPGTNRVRRWAEADAWAARAEPSRSSLRPESDGAGCRRWRRKKLPEKPRSHRIDPKVESAMHGRQKRHSGPAQDRQGQPVDMRVDQVEFARALGDGLDQQRAGGIRISPLHPRRSARGHTAWSFPFVSVVSKHRDRPHRGGRGRSTGSR
ncbi:hypothetical protein GA0061098_1006386 [Bradyrhizobium shewense]|uniref:Uncharacterized protein n=1 Tax=Bradyrhizobium shewense TaxID=1761772 RepID=A0A1C3W764_9BRAD|nr:hypothetical protein GA0061098_1006386 [Bradyrhizobium shewense]